jgi:Ca2+-binding EF-hand superfamily protein
MIKIDFPKGHISKKDFIDLYKRLYPLGDPKKYAKLTFVAFDHDSNGRISFKEFIFATGFLYDDDQSNDLQGRMENLFNVFDLDGNKKITKKELYKLLDAIYEMHNKSENMKDKVDEIFMHYDSDNSGDLSKDEFFLFLRNNNLLDL